MSLKENYKTNREKMDLVYNIQNNIQDYKLVAIINNGLKTTRRKI